jgi:hypothetical protein
MKNSAADYRLHVWSVLPPMLAERIRRHYHVLYGKRFTASNDFAQSWHEFTTDDAFRERIETKPERRIGRWNYTIVPWED